MEEVDGWRSMVIATCTARAPFFCMPFARFRNPSAAFPRKKTCQRGSSTASTVKIRTRTPNILNVAALADQLASHVQRQPVLRESLQNPKIPAEVSSTVREH